MAFLEGKQEEKSFEEVYEGGYGGNVALRLSDGMQAQRAAWEKA